MRSSYKVVVCDIDGTLIAPGRETISQENIDAIHQLHEKGILFVLATGRVFQGIKHLIPLLGLDKVASFAICNNGAQIFDLRNNEEIYSKTVDSHYLFQIDDLVSGQAAYLLNQKEFAVMSKYNQYGIQHDHDKIDYDFYWPQDIKKHFNTPTYRVMVTEEGSIIDSLEKVLHNSLVGVSIARNNDIFLDITHIEADKGIALEYLMNTLNIDLSEVIACGDGGNDVNMLKKVGLGLLLDNASDAVKTQVKSSGIHAKDHIVDYILKNKIN